MGYEVAFEYTLISNHTTVPHPSFSHDADSIHCSRLGSLPGLVFYRFDAASLMGGGRCDAVRGGFS